MFDGILSNWALYPFLTMSIGALVVAAYLVIRGKRAPVPKKKQGVVVELSIMVPDDWSSAKVSKEITKSLEWNSVDVVNISTCMWEKN